MNPDALDSPNGLLDGTGGAGSASIAIIGSCWLNRSSDCEVVVGCGCDVVDTNGVDPTIILYFNNQEKTDFTNINKKIFADAQCESIAFIDHIRNAPQQSPPSTLMPINSQASG